MCVFQIGFSRASISLYRGESIYIYLLDRGKTVKKTGDLYVCISNDKLYDYMLYSLPFFLPIYKYIGYLFCCFLLLPVS